MDLSASVVNFPEQSHHRETEDPQVYMEITSPTDSMAVASWRIYDPVVAQAATPGSDCSTAFRLEIRYDYGRPLVRGCEICRSIREFD